MCLISGNPDFQAVSEPPQKKVTGLGATWGEEGLGCWGACAPRGVCGERLPGAAPGSGPEEEDHEAAAQGQFPRGL